MHYFVTNSTSTGRDFSTSSPAISLIAVRIAVSPISSGFCATVAVIFPVFTSFTASSVASNPTTLISFLLAAIACSAPSAISSLWANTPLSSGSDWSMFSITDIPSARSKFALWLAATSRTSSAAS